MDSVLSHTNSVDNIDVMSSVSVSPPNETISQLYRQDSEIDGFENPHPVHRDQCNGISTIYRQDSAIDGYVNPHPMKRSKQQSIRHFYKYDSFSEGYDNPILSNPSIVPANTPPSSSAVLLHESPQDIIDTPDKKTSSKSSTPATPEESMPPTVGQVSALRAMFENRVAQIKDNHDRSQVVKGKYKRSSKAPSTGESRQLSQFERYNANAGIHSVNPSENLPYNRRERVLVSPLVTQPEEVEYSHEEKVSFESNNNGDSILSEVDTSSRPCGSQKFESEVSEVSVAIEEDASRHQCILSLRDGRTLHLTETESGIIEVISTADSSGAVPERVCLFGNHRVPRKISLHESNGEVNVEHTKEYYSIVPESVCDVPNDNTSTATQEQDSTSDNTLKTCTPFALTLPPPPPVKDPPSEPKTPSMPRESTLRREAERLAVDDFFNETSPTSTTAMPKVTSNEKEVRKPQNLSNAIATTVNTSPMRDDDTEKPARNDVEKTSVPDPDKKSSIRDSMEGRVSTGGTPLGVPLSMKDLYLQAMRNTDYSAAGRDSTTTRESTTARESTTDRDPSTDYLAELERNSADMTASSFLKAQEIRSLAKEQNENKNENKNSFVRDSVTTNDKIMKDDLASHVVSVDKKTDTVDEIITDITPTNDLVLHQSAVIENNVSVDINAVGRNLIDIEKNTTAEVTRTCDKEYDDDSVDSDVDSEADSDADSDVNVSCSTSLRQSVEENAMARILAMQEQEIVVDYSEDEDPDVSVDAANSTRPQSEEVEVQITRLVDRKDQQLETSSTTPRFKARSESWAELENVAMARLRQQDSEEREERESNVEKLNSDLSVVMNCSVDKNSDVNVDAASSTRPQSEEVEVQTRLEDQKLEISSTTPRFKARSESWAELENVAIARLRQQDSEEREERESNVEKLNSESFPSVSCKVVEVTQLDKDIDSDAAKIMAEDEAVLARIQAREDARMQALSQSKAGDIIEHKVAEVKQLNTNIDSDSAKIMAEDEAVLARIQAREDARMQALSQSKAEEDAVLARISAREEATAILKKAGSKVYTPDSDEANKEDTYMLRRVVTFPVGEGDGPTPLGMSLKNERGSGQAFVSKLVEGGVAERIGVQLKDYVEEVNSVPTPSYHETMQQIQAASLPITLTLSQPPPESHIDVGEETCRVYHYGDDLTGDHSAGERRKRKKQAVAELAALHALKSVVASKKATLKSLRKSVKRKKRAMRGSDVTARNSDLEGSESIEDARIRKSKEANAALLARQEALILEKTAAAQKMAAEKEDTAELTHQSDVEGGDDGKTSATHKKQIDSECVMSEEEKKMDGEIETVVEVHDDDSLATPTELANKQGIDRENDASASVLKVSSEEEEAKILLKVSVATSEETIDMEHLNSSIIDKGSIRDSVQQSDCEDEELIEKRKATSLFANVLRDIPSSGGNLRKSSPTDRLSNPAMRDTDVSTTSVASFSAFADVLKEMSAPSSRVTSLVRNEGLVFLRDSKFGGDSTLMNSIMQSRFLSELDDGNKVESTWSSDDDD